MHHQHQTRPLSRVTPQYFFSLQVLDVEAAIQQRKSEVKNFLSK